MNSPEQDIADSVQHLRILRNASFVGMIVVAVASLWPTLSAVTKLALESEQYSHLLLIPFISGWLFYLKRKEISAKLEWSAVEGILGSLAGAISCAWGLKLAQTLGQADSLSIVTAGFVVLCLSAFVLCYGRHAFREAVFPLFFLFLMVPLPISILNVIIYELQMGSSAIAFKILDVCGVPVLRNGFIFLLPGISIEVAKECSGIRSSMALFITCLVASYLFLRSNLSRLTLILITVPVALIKNGIRIATLSVLALYVDRSFLTGRLHHQGGFVFFLLALAIVFVEIWVLQTFENSFNGVRSPSQVPAQDILTK